MEIIVQAVSKTTLLMDNGGNSFFTEVWTPIITDSQTAGGMPESIKKHITSTVLNSGALHFRDAKGISVCLPLITRHPLKRDGQVCNVGANSSTDMSGENSVLTLAAPRATR